MWVEFEVIWGKGQRVVRDQDLIATTHNAFLSVAILLTIELPNVVVEANSNGNAQ